MNENESIESLELSIRTYHCLKRAKINTISELTQYSENALLSIFAFGRKSLTEIKWILEERGLKLLEERKQVELESPQKELISGMSPKVFFIKAGYFFGRGEFSKSYLYDLFDRNFEKKKPVKIQKPGPKNFTRNLGIFLSHLTGFTYREIAEHYNISVERARQIIIRINRVLTWNIGRMYRAGASDKNLRDFLARVEGETKDITEKNARLGQD